MKGTESVVMIVTPPTPSKLIKRDILFLSRGTDERTTPPSVGWTDLGHLGVRSLIGHSTDSFFKRRLGFGRKYSRL